MPPFTGSVHEGKRTLFSSLKKSSTDAFDFAGPWTDHADNLTFSEHPWELTALFTEIH